MSNQQRARELWSNALRKVGQHEYAYHVGCGGDLDPGEQATLDAITAALRTAPEVIRIPAANGLDPITVYADDLGEGHGRLTVCCYSDSWSYTAGWGAMGGSLHSFIADLDPHYLADNLLWPNAAKTRKHQRQYVERIAAAVIAAFAARPQGVKDA